MDTPRLTRETRERIEAQHADAIRRVLAAEAATLGLLSATVDAATQRLVAAVATGTDDELQLRRSVHQAVSRESARLQQEFGEAVRGGRGQARQLARGQAELELGLIQAGMRSLGSDEQVPGVTDVDSTEVDEAQGQLASASMAATWSAAALAVFSQWRSKRESTRRLPGRLSRTSRLVDGRVRRHAATQALDAYNREHGRAFPVPAPRRAGRASSASRGLAGVTLPASRPRGHQAQTPGAPQALGGLPAPLPQPLPTPRPLPLPPPPVPPGGRGTPPDQDPLKGRGQPDSEDDVDELDDIETEQGLPFGWDALTYDVWSAVLDRKTCKHCFDRDGRMTPVAKRASVDWPIAHPFCRCVQITVCVPESARKKLPGLQIDYGQLKEDVREYFRNSSVRSLKGKRHIEDYLQGTIDKNSPETLTRKVQNQRGYAVEPRRPRAPKLPGPVTSGSQSGGVGGAGSGSGGSAPDWKHWRQPEQGKHFRELTTTFSNKPRQEEILSALDEAGTLEFLEREPLDRLVLTSKVSHDPDGPEDDEIEEHVFGTYRPGQTVLSQRYPPEIRILASRQCDEGVLGVGTTAPPSVSLTGVTERQAARRTLMHEVGHHIYFTGQHIELGIPDLLQSTPEARAVDRVVHSAWLKRQTSATRAVSFGAIRNEQEYFAESFATYVLAPDVLNARDPGAFEMVEEVRRIRGIGVP